MAWLGRCLIAVAMIGCGDDGRVGADRGTAEADDTSASDAVSTSGTAPGMQESSEGRGPGDDDDDDDATGSADDTTTGDADESTTGDAGDESGTGDAPAACAVVELAGECDEVSACPDDATAFGGLCAGPPSVQCCIPATPPCSVDGAPGLCMDVASCGESLVTTPGLCPGDASVLCCTDPATACDPDAMPRPNEGLLEATWDARCPDGMVRSEGFCIDRYEASLVELDAAGDVVASWSPYFNPGATRVRAVSLEGAVPQGYITQLEAAAACDEAGKRLCTDGEWLRACQGAGGTTYPYGDALEPDRCNDARATHPAIEYFGTADEWIWSELGHPCISQIPASLDITGLNASCESEDGALDLMGNLHEWTADPAGTFRGGFYADTMINGPGCLYATTAHGVGHWDYSTGFRCCAD